jgi:hypothetical protein
MEDLSKLTPTELLKRGNDIKVKHDALKQEIIDITFEIEKLENNIEEKLLVMDELERNYVRIIETIETK